MKEQAEYGVPEDASLDMPNTRGHFGSRIGFILAAAGSAIGLGNIWKFPYIAGENGGGAFVLVYLFCIVIVGFPLMIGEILVGRHTQKAPVGAFGALAGRFSPWKLVGGLGVLAAFFMLSFYSIVAGWALHYTWLACRGVFSSADADPGAMSARFDALYGNADLNFTWHIIFMGITALVVIGGIKKGIEFWSRLLMPLLFIILGGLLFQATKEPGWDEALEFVFKPNWGELTPKSVLEALGHAFFTLSLGMGAMITYGSYLSKKSGLVGTSVAICALDTLIALMACMILFPITFSFGMAPEGGPGLVFKNIPSALARMVGEEPIIPVQVLAIMFFALLVFAALTSAISLLEVVTSYFIDQWRWPRRRATIFCATCIAIMGIPSALSGSDPLFGAEFAAWKADIIGSEAGTISKNNWFDFVDYMVSNWFLPLGGLFMSLFVAWRLDRTIREGSFGTIGKAYGMWLFLLRWIIPILVTIVCLNAAGLLDYWGVWDWDVWGAKEAAPK